MRLKNILNEAIEKNLIGLRIDERGRVSDGDLWSGTLIDENFDFKSVPIYCDQLSLTSLYGSPSESKAFDCSDNNLVSLEHSPRRVNGTFRCYKNQITSLDNSPEIINGDYIAYNNKIESLKDVHKKIKRLNGYMSIELNPIKSHVLGLMLIEGITAIYLNNLSVEKILNDGIKNKKHWTEVQAELEEAGFEEYAQL